MNNEEDTVQLCRWRATLHFSLKSHSLSLIISDYNEFQSTMAAFKNIIHIFSSPLPIKSMNKEPKKIAFFSSSSSSAGSSCQLFGNQNFSLDANLSAKNSSRHVWHVKALTEKDRDLVRVERNDKDDEERGINGREVKDNNERLLNAAIVLGAGTLAITKLLTIDHDYWHGWTLFEVLRYAPEHNWNAYEEALKSNPVLAKMVISGIVYSLGDWIAQCYEGKPLFEFDRTRMFRSGLVGFSIHGSLSHYYYQFCEALFPFNDWWVVPAKVVFDQTFWSAVWNSIYYACLGFLRRESPSGIADELKATFWPMLTAGWKLWPFAHLITYGVIPIEQRLLWVDCIELIWVTILSRYSNEKSEARISEASAEAKSSNSSSKSQD